MTRCQGALDPLNDAKGRARELQAACPDHVDMVLVDAGHCPHDEQPGLINREILKFVEGKIMPGLTASLTKEAGELVAVSL